MRIARLKCLSCGKEFLCRITDQGELHEASLDLAYKDGEVCSHVMEGEVYETLEEEYDGE